MSKGTDRLPWGKFVWAHWENDEALALCSMAAQGLWMRLLCIAVKEDGYVLVGGKAPPVEKLARIVRSDVGMVQGWLEELEAEGVFSRTGDGVIYSRRMVREAKNAKRNRENGAKGGNPRLRKHEGNPASDNHPQQPAPQPSAPEGVKAEKEEIREEKKGPNGPVRSAAPSDELASQIDRLWTSANRTSRGRSSRKDVERALRAALARGHDFDLIAAGVEGYFRSREATRDDGEYAKGLHRVIENDRWQEFATADAGRLGAPDQNDDPLRNPTPFRQRLWMQDFKGGQEWREHERGPKPGQLGCRVSDAIQAEFGYQPAGAAA